MAHTRLRSNDRPNCTISNSMRVLFDRTTRGRREYNNARQWQLYPGIYFRGCKNMGRVDDIRILGYSYRIKCDHYINKLAQRLQDQLIPHHRQRLLPHQRQALVAATQALVRVRRRQLESEAPQHSFGLWVCICFLDAQETFTFSEATARSRNQRNHQCSAIRQGY